MARIALSLLAITLLAGICAAYSADRDHEEVHNHHNYYGDVHNHHGRPEHHDDDHHDDHEDDHHDDHHDDDDDDHQDDHHDDHIYRFRIDNDFPGYAYKDEHGAVVGFLPEMIMKACKRAHKKCYWLYDVFTNCWASEAGGRPGWGLLEGWYDACVGVVPTQARRNAFNFTQSFSEPVHWHLYSKKEHDANLEGLKIGFVDGFSLQPECIHDHFEGNFEPHTYASLEELYEAIEHDEVEAIPNTDSPHFAAEHHLVAIGDTFTCQNEGLAVMAHYSSDVITWWNEVFEAALHNGRWERFCTVQNALHGDIHCNHVPH